VRTIILAGGYARRLWTITWDRPKPLLPVAGKPILDWLMDRIPDSDRPILSVNRRFAAASAAWADGHPVGLMVEETRSEEEKLGSMGELAYPVDRLGLNDDLLVIGGDKLFELDLAEFVLAFRPDARGPLRPRRPAGPTSRPTSAIPEGRAESTPGPRWWTRPWNARWSSARVRSGAPLSPAAWWTRAPASSGSSSATP
jgi:hypothetical protein